MIAFYEIFWYDITVLYYGLIVYPFVCVVQFTMQQIPRFYRGKRVNIPIVGGRSVRDGRNQYLLRGRVKHNA